ERKIEEKYRKVTGQHILTAGAGGWTGVLVRCGQSCQSSLGCSVCVCVCMCVCVCVCRCVLCWCVCVGVGGFVCLCVEFQGFFFLNVRDSAAPVNYQRLW